MEFQRINNGEDGLTIRTKLNTMLQAIIQDTTGLPGKMVRIANFTEGNIPVISSNGMLEDSGKSFSDFFISEDIAQDFGEDTQKVMSQKAVTDLFTVQDTINGHTYRWGITCTNGVASIELTVLE